MTAPDSSPPRLNRIVGVALLGLAVVALVLGLLTLFDGDDGDGNAEQPPGTSTSRPSSTSTSSGGTTGRPPSSTTSSIPGSSSPPASSSGAPTTTGSGGGETPPPDGNGEPSKSVPVIVLNNSKVKGLANEASGDLKADGWQVSKVGNYSATNVPTTTAYYRAGTEEEAAARAIATTFGMEVAPRLDTLANQPAGVIVVVTNGYGDTGGKNEG